MTTKLLLVKHIIHNNVKNLLNRVFNRSASKKETALPGQVVRVDLDQIGPAAQTELAELARETVV